MKISNMYSPMGICTHQWEYVLTNGNEESAYDEVAKHKVSVSQEGCPED